MNKKRRIIVALSVALVSLGVVPNAQAAPTVSVQGGPLTNLDPNGADIHFGFGNFPTAHGLYLFEAVKPADGARPTIFDQAGTAWVSNDPTAPFSPKGDVKVRVKGVIGSTDCYSNQCGIFVRLDHTAPTDTSEDQFIPISFSAATTTTTELPKDVITVKVNGAVVAPNVPGTLAYRTPITFDVSTTSGAAVTYKSYTPECVVEGSTITALKGVGQCDIAVTSPGNSNYATATSHYPFILALGVQTVTPKGLSATSGKKITLAKVTNFGESISYSSASPKVCAVVKNSVKVLKSGNCVLVAKAAAASGLFGPYSSKITLKVSK